MSTAGLTKAEVDGTSASVTPFLGRVYDTYRTSLLSHKYYGFKLKRAKQLNLSAEILIALTTATGVSGLTIWTTYVGGMIWPYVAGTAAVLAAIKPVLQMSNRISTYSKLYAGHFSNSLALKTLVDRIAEEQRVTVELKRAFDDLERQHRELLEREASDESHPSRKLLERFQDEVDVEVPPDSFWYPLR